MTCAEHEGRFEDITEQGKSARKTARAAFPGMPEKACLAVLAILLLWFVVLLAGCGSSGSGDGDTVDADNGSSGGLEQDGDEIRGNPILTSGTMVVLAWNDLGMHCLNPTYDKAVILPPYNTVWAQVVRRGNPPQLVTSGVRVQYAILNNTTSIDKTYDGFSPSSDYGQFWQFDVQLFGVDLAADHGLNLVDPGLSNSLSGEMILQDNHYAADGIPVTPVNDSGAWNPYQVAEITVRDEATNEILATTRCTVPTSDEINCGKSGCHDTADPFGDVLAAHDANQGTTLVADAPVLCAQAGCHGSPVLNLAEPEAGGYLSGAIHGAHAELTTRPACYDCHPGNSTQCSRSLRHNGNGSDGNCTTCHGSLAQVASSIEAGRVPWAEEPKCWDCHYVNNTVGADTGDRLYRDGKCHGGLNCAACHQSPHAMVPAREASDNYQARQYMSADVSLASCAACHESSRGEEIDEFAETHGGENPEHVTACHVCHTAVSDDVLEWPHDFTWKGR